MSPMPIVNRSSSVNLLDGWTAMHQRRQWVINLIEQQKCWAALRIVRQCEDRSDQRTPQLSHSFVGSTRALIARSSETSSLSACALPKNLMSVLYSDKCATTNHFPRLRSSELLDQFRGHTGKLTWQMDTPAYEQSLHLFQFHSILWFYAVDFDINWGMWSLKSVDHLNVETERYINKVKMEYTLEYKFEISYDHLD